MSQGNTSAPVALPVYVLAGGRSRRFGAEKARALLRGEPLLVHAVRALAPLASRVTVVAARGGSFTDLGLTTIGDLSPGLGPLGGLQTALADLGPHERWLLLGSCDRLGIRADWLHSLLRRRHAVQSAPAVAFRGEYWEPLPGLYRRELLPIVEPKLRGGTRSLQALLEHVGAAAEPLPAAWEQSVDINDPAALLRIAGEGAAQGT